MQLESYSPISLPPTFWKAKVASTPFLPPLVRPSVRRPFISVAAPFLSCPDSERTGGGRQGRPGPVYGKVTHCIISLWCSERAPHGEKNATRQSGYQVPCKHKKTFHQEDIFVPLPLQFFVLGIVEATCVFSKLYHSISFFPKKVVENPFCSFIDSTMKMEGKVGEKSNGKPERTWQRFVPQRRRRRGKR